MKLVRYGPDGFERPGLIDSDGAIRDLSASVRDLSHDELRPESLRQLATIPTESLPRVPNDVRLGACVTGIGKFIGVGLNYLDHVRETGGTIPAEPILFMKATSCITGPSDAIFLPQDSSMVDWEVELGVVIGSRAKNVAASDALNCVAGYCVVNDLSERNWQLQGTGQWVKGKSADSFGPVGPWLVTRDEIADPQALRLWLSVNGRMRQDSSTEQMIFPVSALVSYISKYMTLYPGDLIATGTPPGVALGVKPPLYLKQGDVVKCGIDGLGEQSQRVTAE